MTDEAMIRFLDDMFGRENYTYDAACDVWVAPNTDGDGRGFVVVERGGSWFKAVIPAEVLQ